MNNIDQKVTSFTNEYGNRLEKTELFSTDDNTPLGSAWKEYDANGNLIYEKYSTHVVRAHIYEDNKLVDTYDISKRGSIIAIRIFYDKNRSPMAELAFAFGGSVIIDWCNVAQRNAYSIGMNGYTMIYDERINKSFDAMTKW